MIVRLSSTSAVVGRSMPSALNSSLMALAKPRPATMPTIEPIRPMVSASSSTELSTCRRVAPSVRSRASSRARWATVIENVLKIRNAPTSTAMNANASRPVVRNDRPSRMSSPAASASCAAVRTCAVGGRIEATLRWSSLSEVPDFAATNAKSTSLRLSNSACAVARSKTTTVAPPRPADDPSVTVPTSVYGFLGPPAATVTVSPTS